MKTFAVVMLVEQGRETFIQRPNGGSSVSSDPGERYIRVPEHGVSNSSSYDVSAASALPSPLQPNLAVGGYPSVFPVLSEVTSVKQSGDNSGEPYIRLEDCYSGQPVHTPSTLPVYSASRGRQAASQNKASRQVCASGSIDADAANRFGDLTHHKVEYCNEYELGEHDSMFINVKSNCDYAADVGGDCLCNDDDSNESDVEEDYCHYKYPTIHYGVPHSVLSELSEHRRATENPFREPVYVNCSNVIGLNYNGRSGFHPSVNRCGIRCESVLTSPGLPRLLPEQSSSSQLLSLSNRQHCNVSRFCPGHSVSNISRACTADEEEDNDDDDMHSYVNVPLFYS